ncbi:MAG: hypothetical protein HFJ48_01510 [Clostridia bacterium]|nr:hypothetical protein [Clostridia bacterium]
MIIKKSEQGLYLILKGNFENCINTGVTFCFNRIGVIKWTIDIMTQI